MIQNASTWVVFGIPLLALVASSLFFAINRARDAVLTFAVTAWFVVSGLFALSGLPMKWDMKPPPMVLGFVSFVLVTVFLARSRYGRSLVRETPVHLLIATQAFRFPLELVMHRAAQDGVMPMQMSYSGFNFDIVTGITALPVAYLTYKGLGPAWLAKAWNLLGTVTLVVVLVIALGSTPPIHAFGESPDRINIWIAQFPFIWLPAVMVVFAATAHIALWRKGTMQDKPKGAEAA